MIPASAQAVQQALRLINHALKVSLHVSRRRDDAVELATAAPAFRTASPPRPSDVRAVAALDTVIEASARPANRPPQSSIHCHRQRRSVIVDPVAPPMLATVPATKFALRAICEPAVHAARVR